MKKNNVFINFMNNSNNIVKSINNNKFVLAFCLILLNIGSKYINLNLTKGQEILIKSISSEILIFAISFMGSHDIIVSFIITLLFSLLSKFLFNENSNYCILPSNFKKIVALIDKNGDNQISTDEFNEAKRKLNDINNK